MDRLLILSLLYLSGCGTCGEVTKNRMDFRTTQAQARSDGKPQVRIDVPAGIINRWFRDQVRALPNVALELEGLSELQRVLGQVDIRTRRITADIKPNEKARFDVDLDVFMNQRILFSLRFKLEAPIKLDPKTGTIEIKFSGESLKELRPQLTGNAKSNLTANLLRIMPAILRPVFLRKRVETIVEVALEGLTRNAAKLLVDRILGPMGVFTRVQLKVPDLPIERVVLKADQSRWSFGIFSAIPGPGIAPLIRRGSGESIQVGFGADFLTRLANWSMENEKIPSHFGLDGRPDPEGPFTAGLRWSGGKRPLKLHLWSQRSEKHGCVRARVGGRVLASLAAEQLDVQVEDARIEEVEGALGSVMPLEFMRMTGSSLDVSRRICTGTRLTLGGTDLPLIIRKVTVSDRIFLFELSVVENIEKDAGRPMFSRN